MSLQTLAVLLLALGAAGALFRSCVLPAFRRAPLGCGGCQGCGSRRR